MIAACAVIALAVAAPAQAGPPEQEVPSVIAVRDGHKLFLVAHATGVQIYRCDGATWGPSTPRAELFDDHGAAIGTHYGGPTWEARDGSTVKARRVDGVTVDPTAIPWLLLSAASTAVAPDGDRLAGTTFIQRIATTGGLAPPAADCNETTAATEAEVPYTADYYFWKAKP